MNELASTAACLQAVSLSGIAPGQNRILYRNYALSTAVRLSPIIDGRALVDIGKRKKPVLTLQNRIDLYNKAFPDFQSPYLVKGKGKNNDRIEGLWIMGNNYKTSGYYGAYPHGYLSRVMSMFPDRESILHLFSGSIPPGNYTRFDRKPEHADMVGEAEKLSGYFHRESFDLILADPPYSESDAEHYGTVLCKRNTVVKECLKIMKPGAFLVWLDQVFPLFKKADMPLVGSIYVREEFPDLAFVGEFGMIKSTNHRVRGVFIFQKR